MMMKRAKQSLVLAVVVSIGAVAVEASAVEFEPFHEVENVCPDCEKPESDTVELSDGTTVRCTIVAENQDFLVVERYGETRGIPNSEVASKSYADGGPPSDLRSQDQIVLKNGHVLTGSIVDESDKPGHYQLKSAVGDFSYVVFKSQAEALYREGSKETIEVPE